MVKFLKREDFSVFAISFTIAFVVASALFVGPAFAQGLLDTTVDLTPALSSLSDWFFGALVLIAGVFVRYAVPLFTSYIGVQNAQRDALLAAQVEVILQKAIQYAEAYVKTEIADPKSQITKLQIDNFFLAQAVGYAVRSMPEIISYFDLTQERIEEMVLSRLNVIMETPEPDSNRVVSIVG